MMFYYEAKTTKEIAKDLNCTVGKVKIILHRVRKIIRKNTSEAFAGRNIPPRQSHLSLLSQKQHDQS